MQPPIQILKSYYGYLSFQPLQEEIISHILNGCDCLAMMPANGEGTVCFQIPALMMEGTAIVISPQNLLMNARTEALRMKGIAAEALNSNNDESVNQAIIDKMTRGELKLLYVSPEQMIDSLDWITTKQVSMIVIDEAHCISKWGHDFRQEYTQLGILRDVFPSIPIIALTAAADKITRTDIVEQLHLRSPRMFIGSIDRPNLSLEVKIGLRRREKLQTIVDVIRQHPNESGIVYCWESKTTESIAEDLRARGISADAYNENLTAQQLNKVREDFISDNIQVVCAKIGLEMGANKSNVRFIVHYNLPTSIECFYQEICRAGHDGLPSETILFYCVQDRNTLQRWVDKSVLRGINQERLNRMREYAEAKVCRRRILQNYFGEASEHNCGNCDVCHCPPQKFDGTIVVQKALSAILRTNEQVGLSLLLDILLASGNTEVISRGFHQIKTYGAGRDIPAVDWFNYFLQMLQLGFIEIAYNEDSHLKVTQSGREVLNGKKVELAVAIREDFRVKKRRERMRALISPEKADNVKNNILFDALRLMRLQIATEIHQPAYMVFSDETLYALAAEMPTTKEAFLQVWGVDQNKAEQFGERFIGIIKIFAPRK